MIHLPDPKKGLWEQNNRSSVLGTLFASLGLDLTTQLGPTKVSPRFILTTNGITNLGCPVAFKQFNGKIWTVAGSYIFINPGTKTETPFVQAALGSDPTDNSSDYSDLEVYNSKLWTAGADTLRYTDGATWGKIDTGGGTSGLTSTAPHKLLVYPQQNRIYINDGGRVRSTDGTAGTLPTTGQYTFSFNNILSALTAISLVDTGSNILILTVNPFDDRGYIIAWDGITQDTPDSSFGGGIIRLDSRGALAGIMKNGTPYIITVDGRLQYYNGQTFVDAKNPWLPVSLKKYLKNPFNTTNDRWIHPNGITLVNGRINILINNENYDVNTTINESLPSGVWEYDEDIGWYSKGLLSLFDLSVGTISDYGQNRLARVGALFNLRSANNSSDTYIGQILAGANYNKDNSTVVSGVWTDDALDSIQKSGYLVTVKLMASKAQESWQKFFAIIKKMLNSTDEIIIKYRTSESSSLEVPIQWLNSTSFMTSSDVSAYGIGDEVEGTSGVGSGRTAHISLAPVNSGGTWTVTLDESLGASRTSGTARARFQHWIKLTNPQGKAFTNDTVDSLIQLGSMGVSQWVQVKLCMIFTGNNELYSIMIENSPYQ